MHEASIARHLIHALEEARNDGLVEGRIRTVHLRIGRLQGILPDSLKMIFRLMTDDTDMHGALLDIREVDVRCTCRACGACFALREPDFRCTECLSNDVDLVQGREIVIESVEVDDAIQFEDHKDRYRREGPCSERQDR